VEAAAQQRGLNNITIKPFQSRKALSESLGVPDVHLISLRPELEGFVVPSKVYGIAAAGRPALFIGAADGEIASILREAECGATIAVGQPDDLVARIRDLRASPDLRKDWGDNARRALDTRFDLTIAVACWSRTLSDCAAPRVVPFPRVDNLPETTSGDWARRAHQSRRSSPGRPHIARQR
jgi:glycosyltransferase involved in cell wall biosynthesis